MRPHRRTPRPLAGALESLADRLAPVTTLARAQRVWPEAARALPAAAGGSPTAMRDGVLTVTCSSSVWAQELQWMADDLIACLNGLLGEEVVRELRLRAR
jgi:predicted nucleic acid-binding Zn ribbon protein